METLRRATFYSIEDPKSVYELIARLLARAADGDSMGTFDAGYLVETFKQSAPIAKKQITMDLDGYAWVVKALEKATDRPAMEFAASLMLMGKQKWPNAHAERAKSGASSNPLLARNLKTFGLEIGYLLPYLAELG